MTKIEHIECYGQSIEMWYFPKDLTLRRWEQFIENQKKGNEDYLFFEEKDGRKITLNPSFWGSVEVFTE